MYNICNPQSLKGAGDSYEGRGEDSPSWPYVEKAPIQLLEILMNSINVHAHSYTLTHKILSTHLGACSLNINM